MQELVNSGDFDNIVSKGTVLVDFYGQGCAPCRAIGMLLEQVDKAEPTIEIVKVDISEHTDIGEHFEIAAVPTVHMYVDGERVDGFCGLRSKSQILDMINRKPAE